MELEETMELKFWRFLVKEIPNCPQNLYQRQKLVELLNNNQHKLRHLKNEDQVTLVAYIYEEYFFLFLNECPFNILEVAEERLGQMVHFSDDLETMIEIKIAALSLYASHILY